MSSSLRRLVGRFLALVSTSLVISTLAFGQLASKPSSNSGIVRIEQEPYGPSFESGSGETEGDMNCFEVRFARTGLRAIVQNFPDMGPEFAYHQRVLAKALMREVVLSSGNVLNAYHEAGVLYGIEYDWFFPGPMGISRPNLPRTVDVLMINHARPESHFATVFGFRQTEYLEHKAAVEDMIGHRMQSFVVWERETLETGLAPLAVSGRGNTVHGPISACGDVSLLGTGNSLLGPLTLGGEFHHRAGNVAQYVRNATLDPFALPSLTVERLRAEAIAHGTYYPGDVELGLQLPPDGLVFSEGRMTVTAAGIDRRWTLVSASGGLEIRGNDVRIRPQGALVAALSFHGDVLISADRALLVGEVHAPQGNLDLAGSSNTLLGAFVGVGSSLTGSENLLTDGTHTLPLP